MNRFLFALGLITICLRVIAPDAEPAPPLAIQPAVQVTFETRANHHYQLEAASELTPTNWALIGKPLRGSGQPLSQTVLTLSAQQIFRTREYDLTNGLFAHYPLNGDRADSTGNSGTIASSLPLTTNRFGATNSAGQLWYLWYPGPARVGVNSSLAGTNDLTISFWFAHAGTNAPEQLLSLFGSREIHLTRAAAGSNALKLLNTNSVVSFISKPVEWITNRWYHLQLVCKDNVFKLYRNLEQLGEGPATPPVGLTSYSSITIGPPFGCADDIRLYNRALSDDERSILFRIEE